MKRKALFVGVNEYEDPQIRNLTYSLSDAYALKTLFELFGYQTDILENPGKSDVFRAVKEMTGDLSAGDLFFCYFAGHGWTTTTGKHLLFCSDDQYEYLRYDYNVGIPFDFLKKLTESRGYNRAFVLDACRSDFITGTRGGDTTTRDLRPIGELVMDAPTKSSLAVLRSCSKYEHALEIESRKHGLFTLAMMDVLRSSKEAGVELFFGESLCDAVTQKMSVIARAEGISAAQTPEFAKSGVAQVLISGRKTPLSVQSPMVTVVVPALVTCPMCGKKNDPKDTFRCRACGRDNICIKHQDVTTNFCAECALKCKTERKTTQHNHNIQKNKGSAIATIATGASEIRNKPKKKRKWIVAVALLLTFSLFGAALFMNAQGIELLGGDSREAARFEELKGKGYFVLSFLGFRKAIWLANRELDDYPHWLTDKKEGTWRIEEGYVLQTPGGAALSEVVWKPGWQKSPTVKAGDFEGTWLHQKKCPTCSGRKKLSISTDCLSCGGRGRITNTVRCQSCQGSGHRSQSYRCGSCNGSGRSNGRCGQCGGNGTSVCSNCSGSGRIVDTGAVVGGIFGGIFGAARGRGGRIPTGPQYISCSSCGGSGRNRCSVCGGGGTVYSSCQNCSGRGQITQSLSCNSCGGSGRTSSVGRCPHCKSGKVYQTQDCTECQGEGVVWR